MSWRRPLGRVGETLAVPLALIATWWWVSTTRPSLYFPPLPDIGKALVSWLTDDAAIGHLQVSLGNLAIGYFLAVALGIGLGMLLGLTWPAYKAMAPIIHLARSVPPPALLPVFIAVLGIGMQMKVGVIAFGCVWPILLSTITGVRGVERGLLDVARVFHVPFRDRLLSIVLPGAGPAIFAGMRTALGIGVILVVISEMVAASSGVGYFIIASQRGFRILDMWAGTVVMGVVGFLLSAMLLSVERRVLHWAEPYRSQAARSAGRHRLLRRTVAVG